MPSPRLSGHHFPKRQTIESELPASDGELGPRVSRPPTHPPMIRILIGKLLYRPTRDDTKSGAWGSSPIESYFDNELDPENR